MINKSTYDQSPRMLSNSEEVSIPIVNCDYSLNISCIDLLSNNAVGFPHLHNSDFEIYFMLKGKLDIIIDSNKHTLSQGEFIIIAPGVVHNALYNPIDKNQHFIIIFNLHENPYLHSRAVQSNMTNELTAILRNIMEQKYFIGKDLQQSNHYINCMLQEAHENQIAYKAMLFHYYSLFVVNILRNVSMESKGEIGHAFKDYENIATKITRFLEDNYYCAIALQDVAAALFCSPRHINRIFKHYFSSSFGKTLTTYRVNHAKNYLIESDFSIEEIARLVGFSSPNSLFKQFKKMEGITPGQYRNLYKSPFENTI